MCRTDGHTRDRHRGGLHSAPIEVLMKLRRALVTAAATAAIAPIALLSAPAAFADETPSTTPGAVETTPSSTEATPGETPPTTTPAPAETETVPAPETSSPSTDTTTTPPAVTTTPPSETTEPGDEPGDDECTDYEDSPGTLAELRGLPSKVVAGSGWHGFTFRVSNYTGKAFESVSAELYAFAYAYDEDTTEITRFVHVQWFDGSAWKDIDTSIESEDYLPFADAGALAPGEHADIKLRLKVDAKAPTGIGGSMAFATSVDADGVCGFSVPEDQEYRFEILAADSEPGKVPPAKPEPKPSNTPAPQSSSTPLAGSLASTGADSMLPTVGLVGGVAVLAGAGVVYSVRRRSVSDEA
ncbi:LAETG motif-containing sortase-dependent surface protein [Streptomyces sp. cg35]|uniref:LAETG motif-containing sortase-dependent surface protein n=1 Tax=Streptomyces sp. cg35 TaxID=3421650 RepID=UPI003D1675EE